MDQFPTSPDYKGRLEFFRKFAALFTSQEAPPGAIDTGGKWKNFKSEKFYLFLLETFGY
jgi:hypothetical protein